MRIDRGCVKTQPAHFSEQVFTYSDASRAKPRKMKSLTSLYAAGDCARFWSPRVFTQPGPKAEAQVVRSWSNAVTRARSVDDRSMLAAARHRPWVLSDLLSFASASPRFAPKFATTSAPHCQFGQGGVSWSRRTRCRVVVVRGLGSAEGQAPARMKTRRRVFGGRPASECRLCGCRV